MRTLILASLCLAPFVIASCASNEHAQNEATAAKTASSPTVTLAMEGMT